MAVEAERSSEPSTSSQYDARTSAASRAASRSSAFFALAR